jgi:hypothetical protein
VRVPDHLFRSFAVLSRNHFRDPVGNVGLCLQRPHSFDLLRESCPWNAKRPITTADEGPFNLIVGATGRLLIYVVPIRPGSRVRLRRYSRD